MSLDARPQLEQGLNPHDSCAQHVAAQRSRQGRVLALALLTSLLAAVLPSCKNQAPSVVVYAAQDQEYAEPIFRQFTKDTGVKVLAVYDSEAVKTVGLANRLLAERRHPACDVFWGNEELRTRQLAEQGVFRATNGWAAFGFRSRRIVINTNLAIALDRSQPLSLLALTNSAWRGKVALAYPMFGTTSTHFHALRQAWGTNNWLHWARTLQANQPFLVEGNSQVVKLVGRGEAWIGLTDSDDIAAGQANGMPIAALPLGAESLLIPNTAGVIQNCPHPTHAERLFQYLRQRKVTEQLVAAHALEGWEPSAQSQLQVDWEAVLKNLEATTTALKEVFLR